MIEVNLTLYAKMSRKNALALLDEAELTPDKFIAHKDKTFTAKFRRKRKRMFQSHSYEDRMEEVGEHRVAILKRPSVGIDRGPYITMRFAFASLENLGLDKAAFVQKKVSKTKTKAKAKTKAVANGKSKTVANGSAPALVDPFAKLDVSRMVHDVKNLAHEAHKLAKDANAPRAHLMVILEELEKHIDELVKAMK